MNTLKRLRVSRASITFLRRHYGLQSSGYYQTGEPLQAPEKRFLVTGAAGQVGAELIPALQKKYGAENVIASDVKRPHSETLIYCDVTQYDNVARVALESGCTHIIHLASLLSAIGEKNPEFARKVNTLGVHNVLDIARDNNIAVYMPSSIAVFGPDTPKIDTPIATVIRPTTIYGITKVYGELLGEYYHKRWGVNYRSLRYPGVISNAVMPGGGTTDYAVEIYHEALKKGKYTSFLCEESRLPMMYMPDCVRATIEMIEAPEEILNHRTYNLTGMSFTPQEVADSIKQFIPDFEMSYKEDSRQAIADTWPQSIDDSAARNDWGWKHEYDLTAMTLDMLNALAPRYGINKTFAE